MNICVFGSSSELIDKEFLDTAEELGKELVKKGHGVVFGAGKYGVMGAVARGVTAENGRLIGVSPEFFTEIDVLYDKCTELIFTETMRERKGIMEDKADAFIICPGSMGTFEEFFEVLTLKQLKRHTKPIIIYNVKDYYDPMFAMLENAINNNFMTSDSKGLYSVANTLDEVFSQLEEYVPFSYDKYAFVSKGDENNG